MFFIKERVNKLINELKDLIYSDERPIYEYKMLKCNEKFKKIDEINTDNWKLINNEQIWGGHREYFWFETYVTIPESYEGKCVVYELKTGCEGLWDATNPQFSIFVNGNRIQGLDVNHREIILTENAKAGEKLRIILSAFTGDQNFKLVLDSYIKVLDKKTEQYYYDLTVPYQIADLLDRTSHDYITIIKAINESLNLIDLRQEYSREYYESLDRASENFNNNFYKNETGKSNEDVYCVGHTHIDVAWLWSLDVTKDKAVRSFSTVLELMRQYPEYIFMSSQPQLYKYVKENAPEVYAEIKKRVAEGRWETEGGMFLEADCNLSSGESLVRQFIHGKKFFRDEFGKNNEILWLPDVFGYSAALPQIMDKCGIKYFMTTKISWNEFNRLPYDTFMWEGIDGTKILTHFSPARDYNKPAVEGSMETEHFTTYNAFINPSQVKGAWKRYSQKELNNEVLISFGYGDGGGGPTKEMLENQRRLEKGISGCPRTIMSTAKGFFNVLEDKVKNDKYLPKWVGELYLEYHRGTYTSMARNKKYNRKSEFMYENVELFSLINKEINKGKYDKDLLNGAWEVILRNQFHDILPGSSIKEVYEESEKEYKEILDKGSNIINDTLKQITNNINAPKNSLVIFNPNSTDGLGIVEIDIPNNIKNPVILKKDGTTIPVQKSERNKYIFEIDKIPSKGYETLTLEEGSYEIEGKVKASKYKLENDYVSVSLDEKGQIKEIYDKRNNRQLLKHNQNGNVIMTYEDKPHNFDAWDLNNYYTEKSWEVYNVDEISVVENGPVRATILVKRKYLNSYIEQYISLTSDSSEITIRNEIDWNEKQIFMKCLFPVDIHTDEATFEIQYGNVKRKTHYNTSWDYARFEVCMHKWLDVSEDGYGVSVLNDCKYGCSVHDGVIGISMLKSGIYPNPEADKEHHSFTFSIYPHSGDWKEGKTIAKAYSLNNPMKAIIKDTEGGDLSQQSSLVEVDVENVIIEVVKEAEESPEMIIRLYEAYNRRSNVKLTFYKDIKGIWECNMLEETISNLDFESNNTDFIIKPYEIKTFKVLL